MMRWYIPVIYSWGITTASLITFRGLIKPLEVWCWVGADWPADRMGFFYAPLWFLFTSNIFIVGWIIRAFGKSIDKNPKGFDNRDEIVSHYRWVVFHTSMFVVVGMIVWLPISVFRIWQEMEKSQIVEESPPYWLRFTLVLLTPSQGLLNFLLYVTPMWQKSVAASRSRENSLQMAEIKSDEVFVRPKAKTVPGFFKESPAYLDDNIDDYSDDDEYDLTHSNTMPHSFRYGGSSNLETRKTLSGLSRSQTDHHIETPKQSSLKHGRISRLRAKSFVFHNQLVRVDSKGIPVWEEKKDRAKLKLVK